MSHHALIVARMEPDRTAAVADLFAESDAGDLPHLVGVERRSLFEFHGLYLHLIQSREDLTASLGAVRDHPLFVQLSERLGEHIAAYDPVTWRSPRDAMARQFYRWCAHDRDGQTQSAVKERKQAWPMDV